MEKNMRAIAAIGAAAVVITALASPTVAATKQRNHVSNGIAPTYRGAYGAAPAYPGAHGSAYGRNGNVVIDGNRVIGQDPDPNIRLQMRRDPYPGNY
jgi:hypothetical protein